MKLPTINYQWKAEGLAKRDIMAPQKVAGAEARAAGSWAGASRAEAGAARAEAGASRAIGRVYEQIGGYVTKAMMDLQQESYESEAQTAYVNSINQMNELENKLYTSGSLKMGDPLMDGVNYDDSYEVVDGGNIVTMNKGYAPTYEVGQKVWNTQSKAIVNNFSSTISKGARDIFNRKISDQVISKTQNMGRHVLKMGLANKQSGIKTKIDESNRIGDVGGSMRIAEDANKRGIIDDKQAQSYIMNSLQQGDLLRFNKQLGITEDEKGLSTLSNTALFADSYMTTAQKVQVSNGALSKIRANRAESRQQLADWRDDNTMGAIIGHHKGEFSVSDLNANPQKFGRSNFIPLFDRLTDPNPQVSDQTTIRSFGQQIIDIPFNVRDPEEQYREISRELNNSVKRGDVSAEDAVKFSAMMDKQSKAPFNRQPYAEAKKSLFVDILGTMDAKSMDEITNAGVNLDSIMLKKMGQSANVSQLAIRAFEDMNAHVRQYGSQADPIKWWKDNKNSYKSSEAGSSDTFSRAYPEDAINLQNGKMDVTSTQNNIVRAYQNGEYGITGSNEALLEFNKRAAVLKGVDPKDIMQ